MRSRRRGPPIRQREGDEVSLDDFETKVYLGELSSQCEFCWWAVRQLNIALYDDNTFETFRAIHSLLTHASNISRLLWPAPLRKRGVEAPDDASARADETRARGQALRSALGIPDDHLLR